jgi:hypothetical protein
MGHILGSWKRKGIQEVVEQHPFRSLDQEEDMILLNSEEEEVK